MQLNIILSLTLFIVTNQCVLAKPTRLNKHCVDNLCISNLNYPTKKIQEKLANTKKYKELSGDILRLGSKPNGANPMLRFLEEPERNLCRTRTRKVYPKFVLGDDMEKRYVVNLKKFRQGIEFEQCVSETPEYATELMNIETKCVQQYTVIRFLVYNGATEELEYTEYPVPTTCLCMYKFKKT
ncbi:unnamed protein product [Brassicogethes aeneus]|uniref:Spaetzle domain-containing protein n=1 Tax=Brassicogethes aeneus TaxID=1431903 RepID=A0A9P0B9V8_BRAAE|nr:unnamed protein product [Brassicogethes aeneus]